MKIVIIDNYDSFTYNLSHLVKELGELVPGEILPLLQNEEEQP